MIMIMIVIIIMMIIMIIIVILPGPQHLGGRGDCVSSVPRATTLWNKQVGFSFVCVVASAMSSQSQSDILHSGRT